MTQICNTVPKMKLIQNI